MRTIFECGTPEASSQSAAVTRVAAQSQGLVVGPGKHENAVMEGGDDRVDLKVFGRF